MKTLKLVLKKRWYDMIASGEKKEEYREMKRYWVDRLGGYGLPWDDHTYERVTFYLGYAKDRPSMTFEIQDITCGNNGNPKWGAEPGKSYFIIKLGNRLQDE